MLSLFIATAFAQTFLIESTRLDPSHPPPSVTVLEVRETEPLTEALARVPGVRVASAGGPGQPASVFVRGGPPEQTLVLLDGVELNDPSGVARSFDFGRLTTEGLERIEIYRGPETLRYGSAAAGGVINLVTRTGGPRGFLLAGEAGPYSTNYVYAGARGEVARLRYALGVSRFETAGFSAVRDGAEADGTRQLGFTTRLEYAASPTARAFVSGRLTSAATDLDGPGVDDPTRDSRVRERALGLGYRGRAFDGHLDSGVELALHDIDRGFAEGRFRGGNQTALTRHVYTFDETWEVEGLAQYRAETAAGARQDDLGVALIARRAESSFGVRVDHLPGAGDPVTTSWQPTLPLGEWRLAGRLATGFRQASLYQRFSEYGDVNLRAERTVALEASLRWSPGAFRLGVTPFEQRYRDLIDFDPATSRFGNVARARVRGVETEAAWADGAWSLGASHTYLDARDEVNSRALARRPAHAFAFDAALSRGAWRVDVDYRGVGARADTDPVTFLPAEDPAYDVAGARVAWTFAPRWRAQLRIENLFDRDYSDVRGYGSSRRAAYVGVRGEL